MFLYHGLCMIVLGQFGRDGYDDVAMLCRIIASMIQEGLLAWRDNARPVAKKYAEKRAF